MHTAPINRKHHKLLHADLTQNRSSNHGVKAENEASLLRFHVKLDIIYCEAILCYLTEMN